MSGFGQERQPFQDVCSLSRFVVAQLDNRRCSPVSGNSVPLSACSGAFR
ncbi:hypothetical protein SAMN04488026_10655 [Aliiruegeria lutimaris]|uniref:Uncharacterized protein n=1 Tax=Aliiruegeria lutimaris TaxID=571298 RepID=A0A1G9GTC1_9RHOB|nr:hypothetical protein SAMN04488026_10655 [Aliiruegeria lutimaris]